MKIAPYVTAGVLALAFGVAPATAAGTVTPTAAKPIAAVGTDSSPFTLAADRGDRRRGHRRGHRRGKGHRRGGHRHHRRHRGRRHQGERRWSRRHWDGGRRGHRGHRRRHRGDRHHSRRFFRDRDHHRHRRFARKHHRFHRRGHRDFHSHIHTGLFLGFYGGSRLYAYPYYGYDCHSVWIRDYWRGRYARIGATMCYDEYGHPYIVRGTRYVIEWLY